MFLDNVLYNKVVQVESKSTETSLIDIVSYHIEIKMHWSSDWKMH